jgi:anti-sigma factor RsiW
MNCRRVSSLISAYIDGELTGVEMLEIRIHIDDCRPCKLQYESLRYTKQILSNLTYAQPKAGLDKRISSRLDEIRVPRYQRIWTRVMTGGRRRFTPVTAGCVTLGAVLAILITTPSREPDTVVAFPSPVVYTASSSLPTAAPTLLMDFPDNSGVSESKPLIPHTDTSTSGVFSLAGFEGY